MHLFTILKDKAKIMKIINTLDYLFTMHVTLIRQFACFKEIVLPKSLERRGKQRVENPFFS